MSQFIEYDVLDGDDIEQGERNVFDGAITPSAAPLHKIDGFGFDRQPQRNRCVNVKSKQSTNSTINKMLFTFTITQFVHEF